MVPKKVLPRKPKLYKLYQNVKDFVIHLTKVDFRGKITAINIKRLKGISSLRFIFREPMAGVNR